MESRSGLDFDYLGRWVPEFSTDRSRVPLQPYSKLSFPSRLPRLSLHSHRYITSPQLLSPQSCSHTVLRHTCMNWGDIPTPLRRTNPTTTVFLPSPINKHTNPPTSLIRLFLIDQQAITHAQIPRPPPTRHERRPRHGNHARVHGMPAQQLEAVGFVAGRKQQLEHRNMPADGASHLALPRRMRSADERSMSRFWR